MSNHYRFTRRQFVRAVGLAATAAAVTPACRAFGLEQDPTALPFSATHEVNPVSTHTATPAHTTQPTVTPRSMIGVVALVKTDDRAHGVRRALDMLGIRPAQGKRVLLKPNYNTADPAPASTHSDVLRSMAQWLWDAGAETITVGDRAGMGNTRAVMQRAGAFEVASDAGLETVVFDELGAEDWVGQEADHWSRGFSLARPAVEAESVVLACCLKTHRFGGHFTLSLKNSVGMVAKRVSSAGYDYMSELHNSRHQRKMIAEVNSVYSPDLVVIDGVDAFTTGGPERGTLVNSQVMLAGVDRVALDAVGVALLRYYGTTSEVASGPIFEQEQIARAVELGVGVPSPDGIQLITDDPESDAYADQLRPILGGD